MDWEKIVGLISSVIENIRADYVLSNMIIKDNIFGILEKYCTVVYYPLENEKNCGFHTQRYVKDDLVDFVYINTAKTISEQVFTAAHELGHVWGVADQVWKQSGEQGKIDTKTEERIVNRFAAELLMPTQEFKETFQAHVKGLDVNNNRLGFVDLIRVIALQMNDYMVPYEAVRKRMVETNIISPEVGEIMHEHEKELIPLVAVFAKEQNTMLDRVTEKKTIPGLRKLVEAAERSGEVSKYTIAKIKKDFCLDDILSKYDTVEISIDGGKYGED